MAKVMITESYLEDIADAIREKKGGSDTYTPGEMAEAISSIDSGSTPVINSLNVTPSESQQTFNASNVDGYKPVIVEAISATYVGSGINRYSSSDLTVSGAIVTAPAGYYSTAASKSVASGSATGPSSLSGSSATITTGTNTITLTKTNVTTTPTVTAGYVSSATASTATIALTASVTVNPTPTASGATVAIPAGYYTEATSKAVTSGSAGTPTASKGTVSNHNISVTPSVTNTTGYITGGTINGTAVTVSASELVSGTKSITANGTNIDVTNYAAVDVAVPSSTPTLQTINKSYTPTESLQTETIMAGSGYDAIEKVNVTIVGIPLDYVGSGIDQRSSSDLTISGATVIVPAGYYENQASGSVSTMTLPTSATSSATSGYTSKATIGRSTSAQYINIPPGYNSAGAYYVINAVANGSAGAPSTISGTSATVSTGTNTLTLTKTISVTPTVSEGYVSSGTTTNSSVSLTASVTTKAAATITPGTTNQTIASDTYLTGTQTIVGDSDLVGSNILSTANIFGVQGQVVVQNYYTGSSTPSSSLGSNGDLYLEV